MPPRKKSVDVAETNESPYWLIGLEARNFMGLTAVDMQFGDDPLVLITGRNEQGKSCILQAIFAAICGAAGMPQRPVRDGATEAEIRINLGAILVTKRISESGRAKLHVEYADGSKPNGTPQGLLDELFTLIGFDPLDFLSLKPKAQAEALRDLVGLKTDDLDTRYTELFAERTVMNRQVASLKAQVEGMPYYAEVPDEPEDTAAMALELKQARQRQTANQSTRKDLELHDQRIREQTLTVQHAREALRIAEEKLAGLERDRGPLADQVAALVDPDFSALETRLEGATAANDMIQANRDRTAKAKDLEQKAAEAKRLTEQLDDIAGEKQARLRAAKFPVEGLAVDGDVVTYLGLPLEQASTARKIRVSCAIARASNPRLPLCIIRRGNDLDTSSLAELRRWAEETHTRVLCERVANPDDAPVGFVIEGGRVVREPGLFD